MSERGGTDDDARRNDKAPKNDADSAQSISPSTSDLETSILQEIQLGRLLGRPVLIGKSPTRTASAETKTGRRKVKRRRGPRQRSSKVSAGGWGWGLLPAWARRGPGGAKTEQKGDRRTRKNLLLLIKRNREEPARLRASIKTAKDEAIDRDRTSTP